MTLRYFTAAVLASLALFALLLRLLDLPRHDAAVYEAGRRAGLADCEGFGVTFA